MKAQNIDRKTFLPNVSRWQPFAGYFAFANAFLFLWYVLGITTKSLYYPATLLQ